MFYSGGTSLEKSIFPWFQPFNTSQYVQIPFQRAAMVKRSWLGWIFFLVSSSSSQYHLCSVSGCQSFSGMVLITRSGALLTSICNVSSQHAFRSPSVKANWWPRQVICDGDSQEQRAANLQNLTSADRGVGLQLHPFKHQLLGFTPWLETDIVYVSTHHSQSIKSKKWFTDHRQTRRLD